MSAPAETGGSRLRAELARALAGRNRIAAQLALADRIVEEKTAAFARERGLPFIRRESLPAELNRAELEERSLARRGKSALQSPSRTAARGEATRGESGLRLIAQRNERISA